MAGQLKLNIMRVIGGELPQRKHAFDAAEDCFARETVTISAGDTAKIPLGFVVDIPEGYYAEVRGRSGNSLNGVFVVTGIIDACYHGEVAAIVCNNKRASYTITRGDRIAQMILCKKTAHSWNEVFEIEETGDRGKEGFGSTGK